MFIGGIGLPVQIGLSKPVSLQSFPVLVLSGPGLFQSWSGPVLVFFQSWDWTFKHYRMCSTNKNIPSTKVSLLLPILNGLSTRLQPQTLATPFLNQDSSSASPVWKDKQHISWTGSSIEMLSFIAWHSLHLQVHSVINSGGCSSIYLWITTPPLLQAPKHDISEKTSFSV